MDTHGYTLEFPCYDHYCMWLNPHWLRLSAAIDNKLTNMNERFTYCEIGCGHGQTIAINAAANPNSQFYGLDINPIHIESVNRYKDNLGIKNLQGLQADILQPQDLPQMDFIVAHGFISWVHPKITDGLFEFIKNHLAPGGIALISYDSFPGCSHRVQLAKIIQRNIHKTQDVSKGILQSIEYMKWMQEKDCGLFKMFPAMHVEIDRAGTLQNIAHHYGNDHYYGFYFEDVNQLATDIGLEYASNLTAHLNHPALCLKPEIADELPTDTVQREIMMQELLTVPFTSSVFVKPGDGKNVNPLDISFTNALPRQHMKNGKKTPIGDISSDKETTNKLFDQLETPTRFDFREQLTLLTALNDYVLPVPTKTTKLSCNYKKHARHLLMHSTSNSLVFPSAVLGSGVGVPSEIACVIVSGNITDAQKFATECNKSWSEKVNKDILPLVKTFRKHLKNLGAWG